MPRCLFLIEAHFSRHLNEVSELIPCDKSSTCYMYMYQYHVGKVCVCVCHLYKAYVLIISRNFHKEHMPLHVVFLFIVFV